MNLYTQRLDVVGSVRAARKVGQVELNLVPPFVETHRHRANERLDARRRLIVRGAKTPAHVFVVEHHDLKRKVLFQLVSWRKQINYNK